MAQILVERFPVQPCGVGVLHQAGLRGNSSWDSHSHASAPAEFLLDSFRSVRHRSQGALVIKARRGYAMAVQLPAISLERHEFNLGATKIHANSNVILFLLGNRHRLSPLSGVEGSLSRATQ